ncbi:MAG TPA: SOS response-associated peptidase family protein [Xanthobacteraceae bacterium]
MCNEYGNHIPYDHYIAAFSRLKLPLFVKDNGPDLTPRDHIRIRDTAPVIRRAGDGVELTALTWAPRSRNKKPVFNFRSEGRRFGKATRCLIPASHFYEFTAAKDAKQKRKDKWRFRLAGADLFCIAGLVRPDAPDGTDCFTMLTTEPGPDVSPYHDRQVAALAPEDWRAWLDLERREAEILRPLPQGSLDVQIELSD